MMMAMDYIKVRSPRLALLITITLFGNTQNSYSRDFFNPELVELDNPGTERVDLSGFESGAQAPGNYHVDVVLDDQLVDTRDIMFVLLKEPGGDEKLVPCLSIEQLASWGVKTGLFPALKGETSCANLSAIPQASTDFQFAMQRLVLSIPQAAISAQARGSVPPDRWDEGINAALLNYSLSGANNWAKNNNSSNSDSQYANLRPGVNIGPWRLRNYTSWSRDSQGHDAWDTVYTYAQRTIIPLKSQLTLGDSSAPADVFDSIPFRGGQLASDDDMLPDSLKGYAPVVRGIARTNAQVIIRQNGYQIYQSFVAPGAFEITDMYPTGGAGDLDVTIKEADGSEQHFSVPFASLPVLQREGRIKYALTGGQYRSYNGSVDKAPFGQMSVILGLPYGFTFYGGLQESSKYQSLAAGVGKNMGDFGAISSDITQGWSTPYNMPKSNGQSWRARYSKNFASTGTNFAIAGYRYSTSGYYGMQEVLDSYGDSNALQDRRRNRAELTLSQGLGDNLGSLMLNASHEDYWNSGKAMESWSVGYNNYWHSISYGLTWTLSRNGSTGSYSAHQSDGKNQMLALNISIPLEKLLPQTWANYGMNASKHNGTTHSVGLNGVAMPNNALNWNIQQGYGTHDVAYTGNMNGDYRGTYGELTAGYSYDKNTDRLNYGIQGGVVAHANGVTFSQPLGETNVLIAAPGAAGVGIQNMTGATTDYRGYTLASNLMPYRKNDVSLITETLPANVELEQTVKTVVPTRGAIVRANYLASVGVRMLMTLTQQNGQWVPFGAIASIEGAEHSSFIVGESGQVYLTGLDPQVNLTVKWGNQSANTCRVHYSINMAKLNNDVIIDTAACR
ncbi:TPA: fimbria/pilus outer membrane usher protein [Klebsiella pneumoniae]|uniref:fimbria/pilus outer membrane usher protein n=1 Tax=Klebsiella pneumoniae TaxID=573 RepID=UPI000DE75414|nr:fimbria/pilus outer membrane usher protein [Klebsiella pneumoniae]EIX9507298.1 fimbrial biogenesis outer membrane usher protein [Klebsiella pneumoniae]MCF2452547.1 fimbrial biogenesis outer membrane usher protein [Klebsiella pneumoniae]MCQ8549637.1 fimbrial biogenesis outer membrane usher protein [Klebsiella pneumoniae]MCQ8595445.1 fimbrial biogenesis outer membrane usher protein [Klebsiella pneumoniae]SSL12618.1 outer membrane usher protein LpfC [Klebsiella pneumoniae]